MGKFVADMLTCCLKNKGEYISTDKDLGHQFDWHETQMFTVQKCDDASKYHINGGCV
jgi:hypothetical protein